MIAVVALLVPLTVGGQSVEHDFRDTTFLEAERLRLANRNDSAIVLYERILSELPPEDTVSGRYAQFVRMGKAFAVHHKWQDELATVLYLTLAEDARQAGNHYVEAQVLMSLSDIFDGNHDFDREVKTQERVAALISKHGLERIKARLMLRRSSYHYNQGNLDSSAYYAARSYDYAERFGQEFDLAWANHYLFLSEPDTSVRVRTSRQRNFIDYLKRIGNHHKAAWAYLQLGDAYTELGNFSAALTFIDSADQLNSVAEMKTLRGVMMNHSIADSKSRANRGLGKLELAYDQLDSAGVYFAEFFGQKMKERALEIESRYADEAKTQRLEEQERELSFSKRLTTLYLLLIAAAVLFALGLVYFNRRLRKQSVELATINEKLEASIRQEMLLRAEVHHRVKNNLQVIIGLLKKQKRHIEDVPTRQSLDGMVGRVYSMAAVHEILYRDKNDGRVKLSDYLELLYEHFATISPTIERPELLLDVDDVDFDLDTLMPLGILVSECMTNSIKYAAPHVGQLVITIDAEQQDGVFTLTYGDNGPGYSETERTGGKGLGHHLMHGMARQLDGELLTYNEEGAVCEVRFSLRNTDQAVPAG